MRFWFLGKYPKYVFICGLAICAAAALLVWWMSYREKEMPLTEPIANAADCTAFLLQHGIAVQPVPTVLKSITLPDEENEAYASYLQLQDRQSLSLRACAGKQASLYVYEEASSEGAYITLIVCESRIVAADRTLFDIPPKAKPLL